MPSQAFPSPQTHFFEVAAYIDDDPATNALIPAMYDDTISMGELAYSYLALEANSTYGQIFPNYLWYPPPPEYTFGSTDHLSHFNSPSGSVVSPNAMDDPSFFSPSPSPSASQTSSASGMSPEPSPAPEPSCRKATPVFNHIRGKWCCSACDKAFRGKWECRRHIGIIGKQATCLACKGKLSGREDSLRRHYKKYCKGDVSSLRFEDAFTVA